MTTKSVSLCARFYIVMFLWLGISGLSHADECYEGVFLGMAISKDTGAELDAKIAAQGGSANTKLSDTSRLGWKVVAGCYFFDYAGLELSYVNLGNVKMSVEGTVSDINVLINDIRTTTPATANGFSFALVGRHSLRPNLRLIGRLGVFDWQSDIEVKVASTRLSARDNGVGISYGAGLELGSDEESSFNFRFVWDRYSVGAGTIDFVSGGLVYRL